MNIRMLLALTLVAFCASCDQSRGKRLWRLSPDAEQGERAISVVHPGKGGVIGIDRSVPDQPRLVFLEPDTAEIRWKAPANVMFVDPGEELDPLYFLRRNRAAPRDDGDSERFYKSILCVDPSTGEVKEEVELQDGTSCAPVRGARFRASGDRIYFWQKSSKIGEGCHRAFGSIDPDTGKVEWSMLLHSGQLAKEPLILSDRVIFRGGGLTAFALSAEHRQIFELEEQCCGLAITPDEKYMYHGVNLNGLAVSTPNGEPVGQYEGRFRALSDNYLVIDAGPFEPEPKQTTLQVFRHGRFEPIFDYASPGRLSAVAMSGKELVFFSSESEDMLIANVESKKVAKLIDVASKVVVSTRAVGAATHLDAEPVWQPPYLFIRNNGEEIAYRVDSLN